MAAFIIGECSVYSVSKLLANLLELDNLLFWKPIILGLGPNVVEVMLSSEAKIGIGFSRATLLIPEGDPCLSPSIVIPLDEAKF